LIYNNKMQNQDLINGIIIGSVIGIYYSGMRMNLNLIFIYGILFLSFGLGKLGIDMILYGYRPTRDLLLGIGIIFFIPILLDYLEKN